MQPSPRRSLVTFALSIFAIAPTASAFEMGRFSMQPEAPASEPAIAEPIDLELDVAPVRFGAEGSWWITVGGLYAHDFGENTDVNVHGAVSHFVVEDVEVAFELAAWGHFQEFDDAYSVNPNVVFRWHFAHDDDKDWTIYADAGIGVLFASDAVPDDGTSFNFMPRAGAGFTMRLGDSNARWVGGVRWHHISNARINRQENNPSRDAPAFYTGIQFPF